MKAPLLSFYGDDFTGSTDALEVLTWAGLNAVLFVEPPDLQTLREYGDLDAFGVAGTSRTMSPNEMEGELRKTLECISHHRTPITHYKTCSTFDSSPHVGSIGRVMDIARDYYSAGLMPIIVGAPQLGRYMLFGNLYARAGLDGSMFRLDRHPTMAVHPVTPMDEADLVLHLKKQTAQKIGVIDYLQMQETGEAIALRIEDLQRQGYEAAFFDVADAGQLEKIGHLLIELSARQQPLFVVGSSGVEYAMVAALRKDRQLHTGTSKQRATCGTGTPQPIVCVSGSCSPITAEQINQARQAGFCVLQASPAALIDDATMGNEIERLQSMAHDQFRRGISVIVETAAGPADPRIDEVRHKAGKLGIANVSRAIANVTADLTNSLFEACKPHRLIVSGGDTSSLSARRIGIRALRATAPIAPGGPLCKAHAPGRAIDGHEVVFKGGQVGRGSFFLDARAVQPLALQA
jgi:3-oxoisoapionate kinase